MVQRLGLVRKFGPIIHASLLGRERPARCRPELNSVALVREWKMAADRAAIRKDCLSRRLFAAARLGISAARMELAAAGPEGDARNLALDRGQCAPMLRVRLRDAIHQR